MKDELHDFVDELEKSKHQFRKSQSFWKDVDYWEGLCTSLTTFKTIYSGFETSQISGAAGWAVSVILFLINSIGIKQKENNSFQSYLLGIDQAAAMALGGETRSKINEFMDD